MKKIKLNARFAAVAALILIAGISRLLPHPPNVTAMGAMALLGGAYFNNRFASLIIPLVAFFASDLILNNVVYAAFNNGQFVWFYEGAAWTYGSFAATIVLSWFLLKKVNVQNVFAASLSSSVLFFLVTNYAAWQNSALPYTKNVLGLLTSYAAALPFFANSVAGDLFFCAILFGGVEWASRRFPILVKV